MEFVRLRLDAAYLVKGQVHQRVDGLGKSFGSLCTPLKPQLKDVVVASALDYLITGVVADVVQFVRHEQVLGGHLVAADQQALQGLRLNI